MWPLSWWLTSPLGKWKWSSENFFMLKPTPSTPDSVPLMVARAAPSPVLREPISHLHARLPSFISSRESSESLDDMFPCSFYCLCLGSTSQENFQKVLFLSPISLLAFALVLIKKKKKKNLEKSWYSMNTCLEFQNLSLSCWEGSVANIKGSYSSSSQLWCAHPWVPRGHFGGCKLQLYYQGVTCRPLVMTLALMVQKQWSKPYNNRSGYRYIPHWRILS